MSNTQNPSKIRLAVIPKWSRDPYAVKVSYRKSVTERASFPVFVTSRNAADRAAAHWASTGARVRVYRRILGPLGVRVRLRRPVKP